MNIRPRRRRWLGATTLLVALALAPLASRAADHRDGPLISNNPTTTGSLDLNDLFLFISPTNPNNTVLILTTGGNGTGFITPPFFFPGAHYEYRISNDGNPLTDELVFTFVFSQPNSVMRQTYQMFLTNAAGVRQLVATGTTSVLRDRPTPIRASAIRGGGRVTAGIFDDPFFFDSLAFPIFLAVTDRRTNGVPTPGPLAERVAAFTGIPFPSSPIEAIRTPRFPVNGFGNTNTLAIVVEIPRLRLQRNRNSPNLTVWIRSVADVGDGRGFAQFDRTALPAVATTIVPPPSAFPPGTFPTAPGFPNAVLGRQELFNRDIPANDAAFRPEVAQRIRFAYGASEATANALANALLPDVMPFNTTSRAGFNDGLTLTLNGRRLSDDVVDAELNALTEGALTSDRVVNDSFFRRTFPYIGAPLPVTRILATGGINVQRGNTDGGE